MSRLRAFVGAHALLAFYVLTFAVSWGAMLVVIGGPAAIPATRQQVERLMPSAVLALLAGPSVVGLLLTALTSGRDGLRVFAARLLRWRVGARWYAVALLTAPVLMTALLCGLSLYSPEFLPRLATAGDRAALLWVTVGAVLFGGLPEEIGWTGFAVPRLRQRHGVLTTGLIVGSLWGGWHFLINLWYGSAFSGGLAWGWFVAAYFLVGVAQLTAYRVLMVRVYARTDSLLLATLMHGSLIASTVVLVPPTAGLSFLTWFGASAVLLWITVAVLPLDDRRHLAREAAAAPGEAA